MQIDIHFGGIYALCRMAGMKSEAAETVAYSSQQVDDATHGHVLNFEKDNSIFRQTLTAHRSLDLKNLKIDKCIETWVPFHFLPGGIGKSNSDKFKCQSASESKPAQKMINDAIKSFDKELILHRFGITLHTYADTYTHRFFKGFRDDENDVELLPHSSHSKNIGKMILGFADDIIENIIPAVGHGKVKTQPDIPSIKWAFERKKNVTEIDNTNDVFLPALEDIYYRIIEFLEDNPEFVLKKDLTDKNKWNSFKSLIEKLLLFNAKSEIRFEGWLNEIQRGSFSPNNKPDSIDKNIFYDDRLWFKKAVKVEKSITESDSNRSDVLIPESSVNTETYIKLNGFEKSDWRKFHTAANNHRHYVLYDLLPDFGVICC